MKRIRRKVLVVAAIICLMLVSTPTTTADDVEFPKENGPYTVFIAGWPEAVPTAISDDIVSQPLLQVNITEPKNAIYWNNRKVLPFRFAPVILWGNIIIKVKIEPISEVDKVEVYLNGEIFETLENPFSPLFIHYESGPFLSRTTFGITAYGVNATQDSDEIVIWRLFPTPFGANNIFTPFLF